MNKNVNLPSDLLAYLHTQNSKAPPEKVFETWVKQAETVPPAQEVPMLIRMIENYQKSKLEPELLKECYRETFRKSEEELEL